jgi:hypothetical protein
MSNHSFVSPGVFDPEALAAIGVPILMDASASQNGDKASVAAATKAMSECTAGSASASS